MSLAPEWRLGALSLVDAPFLVAFGADHGSPESSADVLSSFLTDGDIEVGGHTGNRTVVIPILLEGSDLLELAEAEAALIAESVKAQNTLHVDPGDGFAPPFQMTVFGGPGCVAWNRDDVYEQQGYRSFTLTLRALPYAFSADETYTAPFTPPSSVTTTVIADGTSTTNWSTWDDSQIVESLSTDGSAVIATSTVSSSSGAAIPRYFDGGLIRTALVTLGSQPYLAVDQRFETSNGYQVNDDLRIYIDHALKPVLAVQYLSSGYYRYWVDASAGGAKTSFTLLEVLATIGPVPGQLQGSGVALRAKIDQVITSDSYSTVSTTKQLQRTIPIGGTAPTTGSVDLQHETAALGDVLLYTSTRNASPALRGFRSPSLGGSGMITPSLDGTAVSGYFDTISSATPGLWYEMPFDLVPEGEYLLMGRLRAAAGSNVLACYAGTYMGGALVSDWNVDLVTIPTMTDWTFFRFGMAHLPTVDAGPSAKIVFSFQRAAGTVYVDEIYAFNMTTGDLTQVACGTTSPTSAAASNRLWVTSPSLDNGGLGRMVRGTLADQSDAKSAYPDSQSPGIHRFAPPSVYTFTVTSNAPSASIGFRHREAWLHTAAR